MTRIRDQGAPPRNLGTKQKRCRPIAHGRCRAEVNERGTKTRPSSVSGPEMCAICAFLCNGGTRMTRTCLILVCAVAVLANPVWAQSTTPLRDAAARAVQLPTVTARSSRPTTPIIHGALIGAVAGAATGWLVWASSRDCGTCGPGPAPAILTSAAFGAGIGVLIGSAFARPDRTRGIPLGDRVGLEPALAKGRAAAHVHFTF